LTTCHDQQGLQSWFEWGFVPYDMDMGKGVGQIVLPCA